MTDLSDLTPRQIAVAALLGHCYPVKKIAAELKITERRVRVHITSIAYRIGADSTLDEALQVAKWWREETAKQGKAA